MNLHDFDTEVDEELRFDDAQYLQAVSTMYFACGYNLAATEDDYFRSKCSSILLAVCFISLDILYLKSRWSFPLLFSCLVFLEVLVAFSLVSLVLTRRRSYLEVREESNKLLSPPPLGTRLERGYH